MTALSTAVHRPAINNQPDMHRATADPGNEDTVIDECRCMPPEHDISLVAGQEITSGFVVRRLVQFDAKHMPVIQDYDAPAVSGLK